jgi:uncharacterized protein YeaO (DUF488 family)
MAGLKTKRVYEPRAADDGQRVLIDRLWPRGLSKEDLHDVLWLKRIAPTMALRRWYDHGAEHWPEFRRRYTAELDANTEAVAELRALMEKGPVTLLYASRDTDRNHARALVEYLARKK